MQIAAAVSKTQDEMLACVEMTLTDVCLFAAVLLCLGASSANAADYAVLDGRLVVLSKRLMR